MPDDALRSELLRELRVLRRGPGLVSMERISELNHLVDFVGHGSVEQAYTVLLELLVRHGEQRDGNIRAYFETSGQGLLGESLDARLAAYAGRHFVDARTALRRSDQGAVQLSHIIRDGYLYERPLGNLFIAQLGDLLSMKVSIEVPKDSAFRRPIINVNGVIQEGLRFELHDSSEHPLLVRGEEVLPNIIMDRSVDEDEPLASIYATWVMPIWPSWMVAAHLRDPKLYARLSADRGSSAWISIYRAEYAHARS